MNHDNIERRDSGPRWMDATNHREPREIHWKMGEEVMTLDVPLIADWICSCSGEAEFSEYWGRISSQELMQMAFGGELNEDQSKSVLDELRRRYLNSLHDEIQAEAERMAQE